MSISERPKIAITHGDPNGIGPEVVLKALADEALTGEMQAMVVGSKAVLEMHAGTISKFEIRNSKFSISDVEGESVPDVRFGEVHEEAGRLAVRALERAVELCLAGEVDAMVTAPISKEAVQKAGFGHPGHTEFLAARTGSRSHTMLMVSGALRVGVASGHVPLRAVPQAVTEEAILEKLRVLSGSLERDFGIDAPKVAVLGLNPHAGEGGVLGDEEIEVIGPALERARKECLSAEGPFPADGFFGTGGHERYDAVLAMYHDQGLVPFKAFSFGRGVNFTAGLPIVRTSPDHGTAFDLAGRGHADPGSMKAALRLAVAIARRRRATTDGGRPMRF